MKIDKDTAATGLSAADRVTQGTRNWLVTGFKERSAIHVALIATLVASVYWGWLASDRYVSEAHVIVQRAELVGSNTMDFGSLLAGGSTGNQIDQRLLRDHLLSVDMLLKLDGKLNLRAHFSDSAHDLISRMWDEDIELELFHRYYLSRIGVEYDESAGILIVRAQAYDPETAHAIATMLVGEGERYMNHLAQQLAQDQVDFLERQVEARSRDALEAREKLIAFQNKHAMVSPESTVENLITVVNQLEAKLSEITTERAVLLGYLSTDASSVVEHDLQIAAIDEQIKQVRARLTSAGDLPLNTVMEEYQRLQLAAEFAQDIYKTALVALEKGRLEATRALKKVSILQAPTTPQYPLEPRRLYNLVVFLIVASMLAGVVHLLGAIVRDHKD
jgi:capsular polysaccharide transport system permease protein